jgi:hypothetical protein
VILRYVRKERYEFFAFTPSPMRISPNVRAFAFGAFACVGWMALCLFGTRWSGWEMKLETI